jgi:3-oxosteroid 1-dehydrogenase
VSSDYDVIVVGSGAAGVAASLTASELSLTSVVLEKAEKLGGISANAWGLIWVGCNHLAEAAGIADSREEVLAYMHFLGAGSESEERLQALVDTSPKALRFFEEAGIRFRLCLGLTDHYYDFAPGSSARGRSLEVEPSSGADLGEWQDRVLVPSRAPYSVTAEELISWGGMNSVRWWNTETMEERRRDDLRGLGAGLIAAFAKELIERGVEMRTHSAVGSLIVEGRRVAGVRLVDGREIRARRGVVLATGGYDSDPVLAARYDGYPGQVPMGPAAATGDGLVMATEHGAALRQVHNNLQLFLGFELPQPAGSADLATSAWWGAFLSELPSPHTLVVNRAGRRFGNESHFQFLAPKLREFDPLTRQFVNLPAYLIFDQQFVEKYGFAAGVAGEAVPEWVARHETPVELAQALAIDGHGLEATLQRFNDLARAGVDTDFGRGSELWRLARSDETNASRLGTIEQPPFYGLELHPTAGPSVGLAADASARVLDVRGEVIPGLYAAGSAACFDEIGVGYQAGLTLASSLTFGYVAVQDMARRQNG